MDDKQLVVLQLYHKNVVVHYGLIFSRRCAENQSLSATPPGGVVNCR